MQLIPYSLSRNSQHGGYGVPDINRKPLLPDHVKNMQEAAQIIDAILNQEILCQHGMQDMAIAYERMEQFEERMELILPEINSDAVVEKINKRISSILSNENYTSQDLVNLYHLLSFREVTHLQPAQIKACLIARKNRGSCMDPIETAHSPIYCILLEKSNESLEILGEDKVRLSIEVKRRLEDLAYLRAHSSDDYPVYLEQILEYGYIHLYDHILEVRRVSEQKSCPELNINASVISHVVTEARDAIIRTVRSAIPENCSDIVFLIGKTGTGKSTTFAFLTEESLERVRNSYEAPRQKSLISVCEATSQTFLPNIRLADGVAYVDFPGFKDTHGLWVTLGIELAFKALVSHYCPKIMVALVIDAKNRYEDALDSSEYLNRLLGEQNKRHCALAFTRYLENGKFIKKEIIQESLRKERASIKDSEAKIRSAKDKIALLEEEIDTLQRQAKDKHAQKCAEILKEIELLNKELEAPKNKLDPALEESILIKTARSRLKKLQTKLLIEKPESGDIIRKRYQIKQLGKEIRLHEENIWSASRNLLALEREEQDLQKKLQKTEQELSEKIGLGDGGNNIIRLDDLKNPDTLVRCREALGKLSPVPSTQKSLDFAHENSLIKVMSRDIAPGELWPLELSEAEKSESEEQHIDVQKWLIDILESSLINVLTLRAGHPEIGSFLHLPEMDPQITRKIDKKILSRFTNTLILCIVKFSFDFEKKKDSDPIDDIISEIRNAVHLSEVDQEELDIYREIERNIRTNWRFVTKELQRRDHQGARTWDELRNNYKRQLRETESLHLEEWERWASQIIPGIPIAIPTWFYRNRAIQSANLLVSEEAMGLLKDLDKMLSFFTKTLHRIRDLERNVKKKEKIEQICHAPQPSFSDVGEFENSIHKKIEEIAQVYGPVEWNQRIERLREEYHKSNLYQLISNSPSLKGLALLQHTQSQGKESFVEAISAGPHDMKGKDEDKEFSRELENFISFYNPMLQKFVALGQGALFQNLTEILKSLKKARGTRNAWEARAAWAVRKATTAEEVAWKVLSSSTNLATRIVSGDRRHNDELASRIQGGELMEILSSSIGLFSSLDQGLAPRIRWEGLRAMGRNQFKDGMPIFLAGVALQISANLVNKAVQEAAVRTAGEARANKEMEVAKAANEARKAWEAGLAGKAYKAETTEITKEAWKAGLAQRDARRIEAVERVGPILATWEAWANWEAGNSPQDVIALIGSLQKTTPNWTDVETEAKAALAKEEIKQSEIMALEMQIWEWVASAMNKLSDLEELNIPMLPSPLTNAQPVVNLIFKSIEELSKSIDKKKRELADSLGLDLGISLNQALLQAVIIDSEPAKQEIVQNAI